MDLEGWQPRGTPQKKRRRPALACEECRRRKVRCCRNFPCMNCIKAQRPSQCTYQGENPGPVRRAAPPLAPADRPAHTVHHIPEVDTPFTASSVPMIISANKTAPSVSDCRTPSNSSHFSGSSAVTLLSERIKELETRLSEALGTPPVNVLLDKVTNDHVNAVTSLAAPVGETCPTRGTLAKTRYYGPSHYLQSASLFTAQLEIMRLEENMRSPAWEPLMRCKKLARSIKARRNPTVIPQTLGTSIPCRDVCDQLVDAYLRTFETVFRVLHVPSFREQYRVYWEDPAAGCRHFIVQMQLVMAIGACFHDNIFSYRQMAIQWIFEAQHWLITPSSKPSPSLKARMTITGLQNMCLLHIARETTAIGGDLVWLSVGELIRTGVYMGLHRDPDHLAEMPRLRAEIRRRLWATIMEIALQASIDSGGPALLSLTDFDTLPPNNYNDDQLIEGGTSSEPRPASCFTETSVQIALYRSFPTRLAIARYLNDFRCRNDYNATLKLSSEMSSACRALTLTLQSFRPLGDPDRPGRPSDFQLLMTEQALLRYLCTLHVPWQAHSQLDPRYYFSRKVAVETALRMYRSAYPKHDGDDQELSTGLADYRRMLITAAGPYRALVHQSIMIMGAEIFWQLAEERAAKKSINKGTDLSLPAFAGMFNSTTSSSSTNSTPLPSVGLGVAPLPDLIEGLRNGIAVTRERLLAGETNIKGHVFYQSMISHAEALQRGDSDDEIRANVRQCLEDGASRAHDILKVVADRMEDGAVEQHTPTPRTGDGDGDFEMVAAGAELIPEDRYMGFGSNADFPDAEAGWDWDNFAVMSWPWPAMESTGRAS